MTRLAMMTMLVACLSGCAALDREGAKVNKFGPQSMLQQPVDVPDLISVLSAGEEKFSTSPSEDPKAFSEKLDGVLRKFYAGGTAEEQRLRRNRVQDRLMLASNDACEAFKTVLKRKQADRNFEFGSATVLLGTAGAVARVANTAKGFAALAGASAGIHAEYNRDYFSDVAAHIITKAIAKRRKELMADIEKAQALAIDRYSVEDAISDTVIFHGACSLVGGLEYADGAVDKLDANAKLGLDTSKAMQKTALDIGAAGAAKK